MILDLIEHPFPSMKDTTLHQVELYEKVANTEICCHGLAFCFTIENQVWWKELIGNGTADFQIYLPIKCTLLTNCWLLITGRPLIRELCFSDWDIKEMQVQVIGPDWNSWEGSSTLLKCYFFLSSTNVNPSNSVIFGQTNANPPKTIFSSIPGNNCYPRRLS